MPAATLKEEMESLHSRPKFKLVSVRKTLSGALGLLLLQGMEALLEEQGLLTLIQHL